LLQEAIRAGIVVHEVFCLVDDRPTQQLCAANCIDSHVVARNVINGLAETTHPRGPVAVIEIPEAQPIRPVDSIVLWGVADPGNAGTILRTAAAFGFQVVATVDSVDLWSPKVVRSAVGAHFRVRPSEGVTADPALLSSLGLRLVAMAADGAYPLREVAMTDASLAFLVGNEARGVPASVRQHPAVITSAISMPGGTESLNVAVTAAIVMYERIQVAGG
jgi:TrmH family RNA methyltransferase